MPPHRARLVIEGELGPRYASAFEGMTCDSHDGETEVTGLIFDPSHLQGLLGRIAGLGLTLRSVNQLEADDAEGDRQAQIPPAGSSDTAPGAHSKGR